MSEFRELPPTLGRSPLGLDAISPPPEPWERQARETDQAWALFQAYRDSAYPNGLGEGYVARSVSEFARAGGWLPSQIRTIAQSHQWHERALAYDRHVDSAKTEANLEALPQVLEDHRRILARLRRFVAHELGKWMDTAENSPEPVTKVRDLKSLLDTAIKLDRLTFGEATEIVKSDGWDLSGCTLDELRALQEIAKKTGGDIAPK